MIAHPSSADKPIAWTDEVRAQARIALRVAATSGSDHRTLGYYIRAALAHGLTFDEVCEAGNLSPATVRRLTEPGAVAA